MKPIRICVADDHAVVREGLRRIIDTQADLEVAMEVEDTRGVLDAVREGNFDVLLLDLSLPGGGGLEVLGQVRTFAPELPVVVLSMHSEERFGPRVLRAGAKAFIGKSRPAQLVLDAIRRAHQGLRTVTDVVADRLLDPDAEDVGALSEREFQILQLLANGMTTGSIAQALCLSASTVSTHLGKIKQKLKVDSTSDLVAFAWRHGLVGSD